MFHLYQEPPAETQEEHEILPGGDPDAGIPAEQADIHRTERPGPDADVEPERPPSPPPAEDVDNVDEADVTVDNTGSTVVSQRLEETD